jgi:1-acyl-sn-glycerol-3-phosphate acyltransferase
MDLFFAILKGIWGHLNITLMGIILSSTRKVFGDRAVEFNRTTITPFFCRLIILSVRMKIQIVGVEKYQNKQSIFMYNHNSFFDIFTLPLTKLKNTRYIFTEKALGILGLRLANYGNDALLLPSKKQNPTKEQLEKRDQKFSEFTQLLKETNTSILTAPEGQHRFDHRIDKFNDGVFKMATESSVQIVPVFIKIAKENNPFEGYKFKPGTITIEFMDAIDTSNWKIEDLEKNKLAVRDVFVKKFNQEHGTAVS